MLANAKTEIHPPLSRRNSTDRLVAGAPVFSPCTVETREGAAPFVSQKGTGSDSTRPDSVTHLINIIARSAQPIGVSREAYRSTLDSHPFHRKSEVKSVFNLKDSVFHL
jgi:hypothetical protein